MFSRLVKTLPSLALLYPLAVDGSECSTLTRKLGQLAPPTSITQGFENELLEAIRPIEQFELAFAIYHFINTGLFEQLQKVASSTELSSKQIAESLSLDPIRLNAFVEYLMTAGVLEGSLDSLRLTEKWRRYLEISAGHYVMRVGGYATTLINLGDVLSGRSKYATRDTSRVAAGSCGMSRFNAFPLIRKLLRCIPQFNRSLVDLGCGTGTCLVELLEQDSSLTGLGIDSDEGAIQAGEAYIRELNLSNRISLRKGNVTDSLPGDKPPGAVIASFLLHEILEQSGESGLVQFLEQLKQNYPMSHFIVIEVDGQMPSETLGKYSFGRSYYNGYQLLHSVTQQRLMPRSYWIRLFDRLGFEVVKYEAVSSHVDSAQLEFGVLLRSKQNATLNAVGSRPELSALAQRLDFAAAHPERRWINLVENVPQRLDPLHLNYDNSSGLAQMYELSRGRRELSEEILKREKRMSGAAYQSNQVLITNGSLHALDLIFQRELKTGDKVVVQAPSFAGIASSLLRRNVEVIGKTLNDLQRELASLENQNIKMVYINSPNNPTGEIMSNDLLHRLQEFSAKTGCILVFDLVYDDLFNIKVPRPTGSELKNTYLVNSISKNYGSPGLRIGWIISNSTNIDSLEASLEKQVVSVSPVTQIMATSILKQGNQDLKNVLSANRARLMWEIPRIFKKVPNTQGNYEISETSAQLMLHIPVENIEEFANRMLRKHGVILTTNSNYFQLSTPSIRIPLGRDIGNVILSLEMIAIELSTEQP